MQRPAIWLLPLAMVLSSCSSSDDSSSSSGGTTGSGGSASGGKGGTAAGGTGATGGSSGGAGGSAGASGGSAGTTGDTWSNYAQGFFATYCIECHGAGDTQRDYSTIDEVIRDKDLIRCGVASTMQSGCAATPKPKQFPINNATATNPKPSDPERDRLVAWIDAGLPE